MDLLYSKIVSGFVIFVVTLMGGLAPFFLLRKMSQAGFHPKSTTAARLNSLQAFACGIFIATCLLHLLPEARESVGNSIKSDLPVSEMIVALGFLLLLVVENVLLSCHDLTERRRSRSAVGDGSTVVVYPKPSPINHKYVETDVLSTSKDNGPKLGVNSNGKTTYGSLRDGAGERENDTCCSPGESSDVSGDESNPLIPGDVKNGGRDADSFSTKVVSPSSLRKANRPWAKRRVTNQKQTVDADRIERGAPTCENEGDEGEADFRENSRAVLKSFVLLFALSLHTVFDGLVVGLQKKPSEVWTLLSAVGLHKALVSVSIALSLLESHARYPKAIVAYLVFFSLVAPLGLVVGLVLTETDFNTHAQELSSGILQSVATGTFMYVTFVESLKGRFDAGNRLVNVLLVLLGFGSVATLKILLPS